MSGKRTLVAGGTVATDYGTHLATLTAFEPEALGHLVEGLAFHRFYFELGGVPGHHPQSGPVRP